MRDEDKKIKKTWQSKSHPEGFTTKGGKRQVGDQVPKFPSMKAQRLEDGSSPAACTISPTSGKLSIQATSEESCRF
ncbi:hypothetical protein RYX36_033797 [Vicia faba]